MSAEFTMIPPSSGGASSPSPGGGSKKGFKVTKPMLFIGGGAIIVLFLFMKGFGNSAGASASSQNANTNTDPSSVDYPSNSVDVASQLQNNNDILTGQVNQALNSFGSQYDSQLQQLTSQMQTLDGTVNDYISSHPNPGTTVSPTSTPSAPTTVVPVVSKPVTPATPPKTVQSYQKDGDPNLGAMTTGTFTSMASATKVLDYIKNSYGPNARIVGSNGSYRVQADMPTTQGATNLANDLKNKKLVSVAYSGKVG